jgi:hypothetical protein
VETGILAVFYAGPFPGFVLWASPDSFAHGQVRLGVRRKGLV